MCIIVLTLLSVRTPPKRTHDPFQPPVDDKPPTVLPSAGRPSYQHPRVEPSEDPVIRAFIAPPVVCQILNLIHCVCIMLSYCLFIFVSVAS